MLSLDKTKNPDELVDWLGSQRGLLSWKLDGLTIVLTYEKGELLKAVTRGNGEVGEIITQNAKVFKNLDENRIKNIAPADYTEGSKLECLVKRIIDRTISNEILESIHYDCNSEKKEETKGQSEDELKKEELINKLEDSSNFANTHAIIEQLSNIIEWSEAQKSKLFKIALENNQVTYILKDNDVKAFYDMICKDNDSEEIMND